MLYFCHQQHNPSELKGKLENYRKDETKTNKELQSIKDRLSKHSYTADELKLAKYKNQTEKCKKDVQSLIRQLKSAQGANLVMAKKKVELRKADCANIDKNIDSTELLLAGRDKLLRRQRDLEGKIVKIEKKIAHYEVMICIYKYFCI